MIGGTTITFQIVEVLPGGDIRDYPQFGFFETGAEAAARIATLCVPYRKFQPRPIEDDSWKGREQGRLNSGYYPPLPPEWADLPPVPDHFAHISISVPTMISYTESPAKGMQDIQTRIKPGKYLAKFYPDIPEPERNRLAILVAGNDDSEVKFARTADEIEHVYVDGPNSCMSGSRGWNYEHPARVYASPDLAVAYLEREARITARTVCWPEKKAYIRIYGDQYRLQTELEELGYRHDDIEGARLLRIPVDHDLFVCPYLDGEGRVHDDGEYLIVDCDGDINAQLQNGTTGDQGEMCEHCEEDYDPDSMRSVLTSFGRIDSIRLCEHCVECNAFYCDATDEYYTNPADNKISMENGNVWHIEYFHRHGFTCPHTEENYHQADATIDHQGTYWSPDALDAGAIAFCDQSREYYSTSDYTFYDTSDGRRICEVELGITYFECEETGEIHPMADKAPDRNVHRHPELELVA